MSQPFCCVTHFIERLPPVENVSETSTCDICHELFSTSAEIQVRLPCGHVVGSDCISLWLLEHNNNTCHYRCELFPARGQNSFGFLEGDEEEDDDEENDEDYDDEFTGAEIYFDNDDDLDEFGEILEVLQASETAFSDARLTRARRERQTYRRLLSLGALLPHLSPGHLSDVPSAEIDALFTEIERRGAFNVRALLAIRTGEVSDRELFEIFRSKGYVWRPQTRRISRNGFGGFIRVHHPSAWSLGNGRFLVSVDSEGFANDVVDVEV